MSEEEIKKALEIIKQPITVHCEEYKYFDQENYDNLINVYDNCLWFVRNFEQIRETAIQIKEENTQLKSVLKEMKEFINNHTILLYTKEAPRQLIGTIKLLEIIDKGLEEK